MNRVTPCRADGMRLNAERPHFFIRYTFSYFITAPFEISPHLQSRDRFGPYNLGDHGFKGAQWHTSPVQADMAEQPVFNWVPFRPSWWVMAYRDRKPAGITQLLELEFPDPGSIAVRAAGVCQNQ